MARCRAGRRLRLARLLGEAAELLRAHLDQGASGHDYVFRTVRVPRRLDRGGVTAWLSQHAELLPLPEEWIDD